jgi:hypothetical protein
MALKSPLYMENNTDSQNADEFRLLTKGLLGGVTGTTSGVAHPDHLRVTERAGTPTMGVDIAPGHIFIEGSRNSAQGTYHLYNDAVIQVPFADSDPTNPRIDIVYIRLRDSAYDVGFTGDDDAEPRVEQGVAAAVPVAPTITDEDYIELARVLVPASATAIEDGDITDTRARVRSLDGKLVVPTVGLLPSIAFKGQGGYTLDTGKEYRYSGSAWVEVGTDGQWTAWTPTIKWGTTVHTPGAVEGRFMRDGRKIEAHLHWKVGTVSGTGQIYFSLPVQPAGIAAAGIIQDYMNVVGWGNTITVPGGSVTTVLVNYDYSSSQAFMRTTAASSAGITHNVTNTWATGDEFHVYLAYEAAT